MAVLRVSDENGSWVEIPAIVGAPGKDGTSVKITKITESEESGGSNIVEFSDGSVLTIKNGNDGEDGSGGISGEIDNKTLILEDGVLRVNTADEVEQDNTLPITSAAVHTTVGNIELLLSRI